MPTLDNLGAHADGELIAQSQSQKEVSSNALDNLISNATQKVLSITIADGAGSPTEADRTLTTDEFFGNFLFLLSGTPSVAFQLNLPASGNHTFAVRNESGQTATVKSGAGATADVSTGFLKLLHSDGSDVRTLAAP